MTKPTDVCQVNEVHPGAVARAQGVMPKPDEILDLAEIFKTLGDGTRLGILSALGAGELCVCELAETLGMSQSAVSHQLRLLRSARLVRFRRQGKNVFYALDDEHVEELMRMGLAHVREDSKMVGSG